MLVNCDVCKFNTECKAKPFYEQNIFTNTGKCEKHKKFYGSNPSKLISERELCKLGFVTAHHLISTDVIRSYEETIQAIYLYHTYNFTVFGLYKKNDKYYLQIYVGEIDLRKISAVQVNTIRELMYQMFKMIGKENNEKGSV